MQDSEQLLLVTGGLVWNSEPLLKIMLRGSV